MAKKIDFVFDTKNLCFLCYRPAKIIAAKGQATDVKTFSLRSISRFMDVDLQRMARPKVSLNVRDEEGFKFSQVHVTVCSRCSTVTQEFTTLYQFLEFTQMKLNTCVQSMSELINKTDTNVKLVEKFRKKMATSKSGTKQVDLIRNAMKKNCSLMMRTFLPRVRIRKFGEVNSVGQRKGNKAPRFTKPAPRSKKPEFSSTILKTDTTSVPRSLLSTGNDADDDNQLPDEKVNGGMFQCLHCENTFNDTGGLRVHIVRYHPEQFFSMFKSGQVSNEDFKVAVQLLFRDVRKITTNNGAATAVSFICTCCGKPFSAKIMCYVHMVQLHHDVLATKLQNIQKDKALISSAKKTIRLPDTSTLHKRRGPNKFKGQKKQTKGITANAVTARICLPANVDGIQSSAATLKPKIGRKRRKRVEGNPKSDEKFSRTCECGAQLSSKCAWNNHLKLYCKLRSGRNNAPTVAVQHSDFVLKRAKNTVGFPRACACGVRLGSKPSWVNHQKMHCKLKFGNKSVLSTNQMDRVVDQIVGPSSNTVIRKKKKGRVVPVTETTGKLKVTKKNVYSCGECGAVASNYSSWYYHKTKGCKLKSKPDTIDVDLLEEMPVDITPSGEICLLNVTTSIEPVPAVMKLKTESGVIKGLHRITSFSKVVKKEEIGEVLNFDMKSYSDMFSKFLPAGTSVQDIMSSLENVLQDYRKFPGNISGCPFCGRGFTQIVELQNHMAEAHFDDILLKLRASIDPNGTSSLGSDSDGVINLDPSLVKTENEASLEDAPSINLNEMMDHRDEDESMCQSPGVQQEDPLGNVIPKQETPFQMEESSISESDPDQLLILP